MHNVIRAIHNILRWWNCKSVHTQNFIISQMTFCVPNCRIPLAFITFPLAARVPSSIPIYNRLDASLTSSAPYLQPDCTLFKHVAEILL